MSMKYFVSAQIPSHCRCRILVLKQFRVLCPLGCMLGNYVMIE